jgi:hypothetical protein
MLSHHHSIGSWGPNGTESMKQISKDELLAFAREFLKLEELLTEPQKLEELRKFLVLARSLEESGGIAALKSMLRPERTGAGGLAAAWGSAVQASPKETAAKLVKDASRL